MAIPLGRSLGEPSFVFVQIVNAISLFYLTMGVVAVTIAMADIVFTTNPAGGRSDGSGESEASVPAPGLLERFRTCLHIPLISLFQPLAQVAAESSERDTKPMALCGSLATHSHFILLHLLNAALFAAPLSRSIQRRKLVLDFVFTIFGVYFAISCIAQRRFPSGWAWWVGSTLGATALYLITFSLCKRRELQDIRLSSGTQPTSGAGVSAREVASSKGYSALPRSKVAFSPQSRGGSPRQVEGMVPFSTSPSPLLGSTIMNTCGGDSVTTLNYAVDVAGGHAALAAAATSLSGHIGSSGGKSLSPVGLMNGQSSLYQRSGPSVAAQSGRIAAAAAASMYKLPPAALDTDAAEDCQLLLQVSDASGNSTEKDARSPSALVDMGPGCASRSKR